MACHNESTRYPPVANHCVFTPRGGGKAPSVLAPVTGMPREGFLLGTYLVFPHQSAKGLSQITFALQSNSHFLESQPWFELWLHDLSASHLRGWDWKVLLQLAEIVMFKALAKQTQTFAPERLQLWWCYKSLTSMLQNRFPGISTAAADLWYEE